MNKILRRVMPLFAIFISLTAPCSVGYGVETVDIGHQKVCRPAGTIVDPTGAPIAAATVKLISKNGKVWTRKTATNGQFYFEGLSNGDYRFETSMDGFNPLVGTMTVSSPCLWHRSLSLKLPIAT